MKNQRNNSRDVLLGLSRLLSVGPDDYLDDQSESDLDIGFIDDDDFSEIDDWDDELQSLIEIHSRGVEKRARKLRCQFEITKFAPTGFVAARCRCQGSQYELAFEFDLSNFTEPTIQCSCERSQNQGLCEHTYRLARYLLAELHDPKSALRREIQLDTDNAEDSSADAQLSLGLRALDSFLDATSEDPEIDADPETAPVCRLVWRIKTEPCLHLSPVSQRPKKRGTGWTKGQRIEIEELVDSPELISTPIDAKVMNAFQRSLSSYSIYTQVRVDIVAALEALAGHDLVELDGQPADVRSQPFSLRVEECGPNMVVGVAFPKDVESGTIHFVNQGMVLVAARKPVIVVCRCSPQEAALAKAINSGELNVDRQHFDQVQARLERISLRTSVEYPESLAGPMVSVEPQPVVLLRSHAQGSLECRLRVKDFRGHLVPPGTGPLIHRDKRQGKPVQCRRDPKKELLQAQRLTTALDLDRTSALGNWTWRILDFEQSLRLLENLESKAGELGFEAAWHPQSVQPVRILGSVTAPNVRVQVARKRDWFGLDGLCQVGGQEFSLTALLDGVYSEPAKGYIEIQPGQWARISDELRGKLRQLRDVAHTNRRQLEISETAAPILQELLEAQIDCQAPRAWSECLERLDRARHLDPIPPQSFQGVLRDYQLQGYRWLRRLAEWQVGGCLADDMGLGKTIQALAVLLDRQQKGPALVIAPTSVGFNWARECERFAPDLKPHLYRNTDRAGFLDKIGPGDLVICSYGLALRDEHALGKVVWGTLILDEAQFVKNSRAKTSQAIRRFHADWKLALTGTPMENHLGELWSIFRNVSPGLFGSWESFRERFAGPIEKYGDDERRAALSRLIQPFVLRRSKAEVLKELPERTETNLYVELSPDEQRRYDDLRLAAIGEIDQIEGLPDVQDQRFRVLALLTRLRQLACHVGLVDASWTGTSAKLKVLVETLEELREEGHRALVFSQFTSYLALIRQALDAAGITYQYLDGSTPANVRQQRVDAFQGGESDAFLISLKAGGTGLNLTAADYVIHMDPWWNPAVEDQATDRAHRIGQTRPVLVYRIVARGTIEEQILELHHDKRDLVSGVLEGTQSAGRLGTDELIDLIRGG